MGKAVGGLIGAAIWALVAWWLHPHWSFWIPCALALACLGMMFRAQKPQEERAVDSSPPPV